LVSNKFEKIYEPREDSFLIQKFVRKYTFGRVLDMGTGSGILAEEASKSPKVKSVLAVDIMLEAVAFVKKKFGKKIKAMRSDLFSKVKGKFDTIIFNPPYLPAHPKEKHPALTGGKHGWEIIERFFDQLNEHLSKDGIIILLFSSFTKKDKVNEIIESFCMEFEEVGKQKLDFEELYVYVVKKSGFLKELEKKKITKIKKLTKGHRGLIYTGKLNSKKVAIKVQRKDIAAKGTVNREARMISLLNKYNIGPKILKKGDNYFVYSFVEGVFIPKFIEEAGKNEIIDVLKKVFKQMYTMDKLGIDKEEMHHPYKHVVVGKAVVLLDFERANFTKKPKNTTQFCQYVTSKKITVMLAKKNIRVNVQKIRDLAKGYKKNINLKNFNNILAEIK
jgi:HemK-related putative methylase